MKTIKILFSLLAPVFLLFHSCDENAVTPEPQTDIVSIVIPEGATGTVCLDEVYDLNDFDNASVCGSGGLAVGLVPASLCVEIENTEMDGEADTICVRHCDGLVCDTTIIIVLPCDPCTGELHECFPYMPNDESNSATGAWAVPNEQDDFLNLLVTPSDPGGGYWEVSLATAAPAIPWLIIDNDISSGGAISSGSAAGSSNEQVRKASFLGYPGESYSLQVDPFFEGIIDQYPWEYNINYNFTSKEDCYEPNDVLADAKAIPKDFEIEAFAIGGYRDYFVTAGAEQTFDWYKITVDTPSKVRVQLTQSPSDIRIDLRLFASETTAVSISTNVTSGGQFDNGRLIYIESNAELEAGTYYIEVHPSNATRSIVNDEPKPDHWDTMYKLRATAL